MGIGTVTVKWVDSMLMTGFDSNGQSVVIGRDKDRKPELVGLKASDLLLLAAASCTAYDVVMILTKQREPLEDMEVLCTGEQLEEPPYTFTRIHIKYILTGDLDPAKVERAIKLSEDKYCSVVSTLKPAIPDLTNEYEIKEANGKKN